MKALTFFRGFLVAAFLAFFGLFQPFFAQKAPVSTAKPAAPAQSAASDEFEKTASIGLSFGLKSLVGLDYGLRLTEKFAVRGGFNFNRFKFERANTTIVGEKNRYDIEAFSHLSNIEALAEWSPTRSGKFRVVAGAAFFLKNEVGGAFAKANTTQLNDVEVTPEEIGDGSLTVDWKSPVAPYLGLAFGRLVPKKRLNLAFEMGGYFKGSPRFDIVATQLFTENERNEPILNENFRNQKFWPNLSIRLGYRLGAKQMPAQ